MSIRTAPTQTNHRVARPALGLGLLALLMLLTSAPALAADDEAYIKYRQTVMDGIGDNMGGIGDILKNGLPLMPSVGIHARTLAESSLLIAPAFEKNISAGATDAKPEIWKQADDWNQAIDAMREAALQLAAAVDEGNTDQIGPRVKALGKACGDCHKSFRKPKEESYKNK